MAKDITDKVDDQIFRTLVSGVKEYAIYVLSPEGNIMTWNEGAERIKGYSLEDVLGKHFSMFYPKEERDSGHPNSELQLALKHGRYQEEGWRVRKDGTKFWANVLINPLYDDDEKHVGFAKVTRDLSERRHAEQSRERMALNLAESTSELQRMAYIISHELQEPLAKISSYSNLLSVRYEGRLGEDADEFLRHIKHSGRMISLMIDDLWTYARVTKPDISFENVSTGTLLREAEDSLKKQIDECGAKIVMPPASSLPTLKVNRQQLFYVFKELIENGIKHHSNAGVPQIEITVEKERNGWTFKFKDNGPGVDKFFANDIFKIYQRLKGKPDETGTGMGLAISRKIVEQQHNGLIGFQSVDGAGATFFVWLPEEKLRDKLGAMSDK